MNTHTHHFIEPLDVLFLRGNKLFGDPGSHGESLVPPWPSVAAGALRSLILAGEGVDFAEFAAGRHRHDEIGTPQAPGSFAVLGFNVARRLDNGVVEVLRTLPADLVAGRDEATRLLQLQRQQPHTPAPGLLSSSLLPCWPILGQPARNKAVGGLWLTARGWADYLKGRLPGNSELVASAALWQLESRVGVGLDALAGRAADGQLFTAQAVAFKAGVGFAVEVRGATVPATGLLRLGGDGRGAALCSMEADRGMVDLAALIAARRCRIVLTTPGLFADGWRLPGVAPDGRLSLPGLRARLVCAAMTRADVISGWDLAARQPKVAHRAAPGGSVYWLDDIEATPEALGKLVELGLWIDPAENPHRRAEGFNRFAFANW